MALERLKLKDFQRLRLFEVELDPLVTCLVGPSGAGKSAVLRGLRWIVLNKPQGEAYIRHGKKAARGELTVDGKRIVRKKGKGNEYRIESDSGPAKGQGKNHQGVQGEEFGDRPICSIGNETLCERVAVQQFDNRNGMGKDKQKDRRNFKAFGTDPPQAVQKILNVSEENFQRQHDSPFWFGLTPGQVSKELNQVVDLEVIDRTLTKLAAGLRKAKAELEVGRQRYKEAKAKRKELAWVERMDADLRGIEEAERTYEAIRARKASLSQMVEGVSQAVRERDLATQASVAILGACQAGEAWEEMKRKADGLRDIIVKLGSLGRERCQIEKDLEAARLRASRWKVCPLCNQAIKP